MSDEKNCKTIAIDPEKYLKSKPPPSVGSKLPIVLRYNLVKFPDIEMNDKIILAFCICFPS